MQYASIQKGLGNIDIFTNVYIMYCISLLGLVPTNLCSNMWRDSSHHSLGSQDVPHMLVPRTNPILVPKKSLQVYCSLVMEWVTGGCEATWTDHFGGISVHAQGSQDRFLKWNFICSNHPYHDIGTSSVTSSLITHHLQQAPSFFLWMGLQDPV